MSLTCAMDCDDAEWYYEQASDFAPLNTKRSRKCCSCGCRIAVGEDALKHACWRRPENDIEERIYGDEVPLATKYMCESCGGIAITLSELGYNAPPGEDMRKLAREYREQREELFFSLLHALDWIDAVPKDTNLPDMPGFNREYVDDLLAKVKGEK